MQYTILCQQSKNCVDTNEIMSVYNMLGDTDEYPYPILWPSDGRRDVSSTKLVEKYLSIG